MSATTPVDLAAARLPGERYGLRLVDGSAVDGARPIPPADSRPLRAFEWALLLGFASLQIAHLTVLAVFARWAVRRLIGD